MLIATSSLAQHGPAGYDRSQDTTVPSNELGVSGPFLLVRTFHSFWRVLFTRVTYELDVNERIRQLAPGQVHGSNI